MFSRPRWRQPGLPKTGPCLIGYIMQSKGQETQAEKCLSTPLITLLKEPSPLSL
jgi:hypothetical protein